MALGLTGLLHSIRRVGGHNKLQLIVSCYTLDPQAPLRILLVRQYDIGSSKPVDFYRARIEKATLKLLKRCKESHKDSASI